MDTEKVTLKIPAIGFQLVGEPCGECLRIVNDLAKTFLCPGAQSDCYACMNRVTVVRTEREDFSAHDLSKYDDAARDYKLLAVSFERATHSAKGQGRWLLERDLNEFKPGKATTEWSTYVKSIDSESCVFVRLDDGVLGRVIPEIVQR